MVHWEDEEEDSYCPDDVKSDQDEGIIGNAVRGRYTVNETIHCSAIANRVEDSLRSKA